MFLTLTQTDGNKTMINVSEITSIKVADAATGDGRSMVNTRYYRDGKQNIGFSFFKESVKDIYDQLDDMELVARPSIAGM